MFLRTLFAVVIFALTPGTVALADPPTVRIEQQATLFVAFLEVTVFVTCGDGPTNAGVLVQARQGGFEGEGQAVFMTDGNREEVPVMVFGGPFAPGEATASAVLICGKTQPAGLDLGATIKISESGETLP
jgi:hypothetical protein